MIFRDRLCKWKQGTQGKIKPHSTILEVNKHNDSNMENLWDVTEIATRLVLDSPDGETSLTACAQHEAAELSH